MTEYSYYNDNRLYEVTVKRPSQADRVFTYTYDAGGRLEKIVYPSSTGIEARFDDGAMTPNLMTVDPVAALRNDENAWPRRETGRKASFPSSLPTLRVGAAGPTGAGWNANGQLTNLRYLKDDGMSGFDNVLELEYEYDDAGNRTAMISTSGTADPVRWEYDYDWLNRLTTVKKKIGAGSLLTQRVYEYDESDNRTFMDDHVNSKTYRYLYDAADQITKVQVTSTFQSRTPGDFSDQETFDHDLDGNMTLRTDAATSDTIAYRWDDQDNLIRVAFSPADTKVLHTYDAGGIRKAKILDDETVAESFYSGLPTLNEVETPTVGSPVEFNYLMGHQLMGFESGGDFFYLLTDGLSSVRVVVDASGDEVAAYEYLEFGEQTKTGSGSSPKTFVGGLGVHDDSALTNLLYMRRRHYDTSLGRYISSDPAGFRGGTNFFAYASNDPVSLFDPIGLSAVPALPDAWAKMIRDEIGKYDVFKGKEESWAKFIRCLIYAEGGDDNFSFRYNDPRTTPEVNYDRVGRLVPWGPESLLKFWYTDIVNNQDLKMGRAMVGLFQIDIVAHRGWIIEASKKLEKPENVGSVIYPDVQIDIGVRVLAQEVGWVRNYDNKRVEPDDPSTYYTLTKAYHSCNGENQHFNQCIKSLLG
ncbi:MAG: RHS repeat domain-containing protein [Vulcanimicrobiota bacterium]